MSQISLTTTAPAAVIDKVEVTGFFVDKLDNIPEAYIEVYLAKKTNLGTYAGRKKLLIINGQPLLAWDGSEANPELDNYATQLYNEITAVTANPKGIIEAWLVDNGVVVGSVV